MKNKKETMSVEFIVDEKGNALFDANDAIGDGILKVSVYKGMNVPSPIGFIFERGNNKQMFSMSKDTARRILMYLIAEGV